MTDEEKLAALLEETAHQPAGPGDRMTMPLGTFYWARVLDDDEVRIMNAYLAKLCAGLANETEEQRHRREAGIGNALKP